nr:MAG: putative capsid protein 1 [Polycipiviridae sp.]
MEITQPIISQETNSRAKEIDHGTTPLPMENVMLNLPFKSGNQFDDRSSVSSIKWAYEQLVSQKQLLTTINIPVQGVKDTCIFYLPNSWETILKIHFRNLQDLFFLKSWKWHLTFELRSNFQQVGMISINYSNIPQDAIPYITSNWLSPVDTPCYMTSPNGKIGLPIKDAIKTPTHDLFNFATTQQFPHTLLMLGENQDVQCTLNWLTPYKSTFMNVNPYPEESILSDSIPEISNPYYDMGFVYVTIPVPMTIAPGVDPNCTLRVWSHLTDVEYSGYIPDDSII